jgi:hypothetical protein
MMNHLRLFRGIVVGWFIGMALALLFAWLYLPPDDEALGAIIGGSFSLAGIAGGSANEIRLLAKRG